MVMVMGMHVMMVAFPMQGHVTPMVELAQVLANHHIRITFVNTEMIHDRLLSSGETAPVGFVSVSDGLEPRERYVPGKLMEAVYTVVPAKIEALIREINANSNEEEDQIRCLIYDQSIGSLHQVALNTGIPSVAFLPAAAALLVLGITIPDLLRDGIIDDQGNPLKSDPVQLAPTMPIMNPKDFVWCSVKNTTIQKQILHTMTQNNKSINSADWVICNSARDLEPGAFTLAPQVIPVGPLLASSRLANSARSFYKQDSDSLKWLDQQPRSSVIYLSFGSYAILDKAQFQELALSLEHGNRPFLWVVRPDAMPEADNPRKFPEGFLERIAGRGRIIGWANQQKVLSHPSVACFVSHCGWNSTLESVSNGVPMLCWPYYADQFINRSYICDIWRVGLQLGNDDGGIVTFHEIKEKIDCLLGDDELKERALKLKEMMGSSAREGGSSYQNLMNFITWIQECKK